MTRLTIEIPDTLAQRLARLAAQQQRSIEQVARERLASARDSPTENRSGPPAAIRRVMHASFRISVGQKWMN